MENYKISVIVPIYNAGTYLTTCLDSLVNQTLDGLQIITVLDCPTDGSDKVVYEYAQKYKNIIVVNNSTNLHVGESRNKALEIAEGKYIGFFDHDDYGELDMFEYLYTLAEQEQSDMVASPFVAIDGQGKIISRFDYPEIKPTARDLYKYSVGIPIKDSLQKSKLSAPKTIWNRLYRNDIIQNHRIRFVDTKLISPEDTPFNIEYLYYCKKVSICYRDLYYHVYHDHNTGNSVEYKSLKKYTLCLQYIYETLSAKGELINRDIKERFENTVRQYMFVTALNELKGSGMMPMLKSLSAVRRSYGFIRESYSNTYKIYSINGYSWKVNFISYLLSIILK